jgi:hypothetical protein
VPTTAGSVSLGSVQTSSRGIAFTCQPEANEFRVWHHRRQRIPLALNVSNADVIAELFQFVTGLWRKRTANRRVPALLPSHKRVKDWWGAMT